MIDKSTKFIILLTLLFLSLFLFCVNVINGQDSILTSPQTTCIDDPFLDLIKPATEYL